MEDYSKYVVSFDSHFEDGRFEKQELYSQWAALRGCSV